MPRIRPSPLDCKKDSGRLGARLASLTLPAYKFAMSVASNAGAAAPAAALELVVAVAENDVIGRGNQLPWHLPADLRHFKSLTLGKPVLMGRRTYESIGKALPGRTNIVLSRSAGFSPSDCVVVKSLADARMAAGAEPALMVIGGAEIYRQCLPLAGRIHLTLIHAQIEDGDTIFAGWRGGNGRRRRTSATKPTTGMRTPTASLPSSGWDPAASVERREPGADLSFRALEIDVAQGRRCARRQFVQSSACTVPRWSAVW